MDMKTPGGWIRGAWRGQPWPVAPVTLVTHKEEAVLRRLSGQWFESKPHLTFRRPRQQARRLADLHAGIKSLSGVFVVNDPQKEVDQDLADPSYADDLVRAALSLKLNDAGAPDDTGALTAFVSSHGPLCPQPLLGKIWFDAFGLSRPGLDRFLYRNGRYRRDWEDTPLRGSLFETVRVLTRFRWLVESLENLQNNRAGENEWAKFALTLDIDLHNMHPAIRWDREAGPHPCWTLNSPQDVLSATIWNWATRGADLRRCGRCQLLFPADNAKQQFCTRTCANRASAARWYRKKGRRLRRTARAQRRREGTGDE